jgi:acetyl-CoA carboxylase carboxyl transferase subunit alpha
MRTYLSFETAVADIDARLDELRAVAEKGDSPALREEIVKLEAKAERALSDLYATLTPWQKTQVARVQERPRFSDYLKGLITDFIALSGDRYFGEDEAIVGGLGRFEGESVCILGQEKGHTAGAFPGVDAEERGQAEAIARSIDACLSLGVPNIAVIIGEGGSGGALAIATCNIVLMLEHAIYTVASPEAAASILWRDSSRAQEAATSMKITAQDLIRFGIIDGIVPEPAGGAHRDPAAAVAVTGRAISEALKSLHGVSPDELRSARAEKFLAIGRKI